MTMCIGTHNIASSALAAWLRFPCNQNRPIAAKSRGIYILLV